MNDILHLIGWISGITLLFLGFVHIILLEKLFINKPYYFKFKYWIGKITVALTIVFFSCGLMILIKFLIQK